MSPPLPVHPITTQYRESDWDFVARLLAEAGLAWRFEHDQAEGKHDDEAADAGARHTLVIFDQQAEPPEGGAIRFHRIDGTETQDAISAFSEQRQLVPNRTQVASWHSEQLASISGQSDADAGTLPALEVFVQPRAGRFAQGDHAQAEAEHRLDALRLPQTLHFGAGSARSLAAGTAFTLSQHPNHGGEALTTRHDMANSQTLWASNWMPYPKGIFVSS